MIRFGKLVSTHNHLYIYIYMEMVNIRRAIRIRWRLFCIVLCVSVGFQWDSPAKKLAPKFMDSINWDASRQIKVYRDLSKASPIYDVWICDDLRNKRRQLGPKRLSTTQSSLDPWSKMIKECHSSNFGSLQSLPIFKGTILDDQFVGLRKLCCVIYPNRS